MVLDILRKHLDFGVVKIFVGKHFLQLRDEIFHGRVLDFGFVQQIMVGDGRANGGIENLLLDFRVQSQFDANVRDELFLLIVERIALCELLVFLEEGLHGLVICHEQGECIDSSCWRCLGCLRGH